MADVLDPGRWFGIFQNIQPITSRSLWHRPVVQVHMPPRSLTAACLYGLPILDAVD